MRIKLFVRSASKHVESRACICLLCKTVVQSLVNYCAKLSEMSMFIRS